MDKSFFDFKSKTFQLRMGPIMLVAYRIQGWEKYLWKIVLYVFHKRYQIR